MKTVRRPLHSWVRVLLVDLETMRISHTIPGLLTMVWSSLESIRYGGFHLTIGLREYRSVVLLPGQNCQCVYIFRLLPAIARIGLRPVLFRPTFNSAGEGLPVCLKRPGCGCLTDGNCLLTPRRTRTFLNFS